MSACCSGQIRLSAELLDIYLPSFYFNCRRQLTSRHAVGNDARRRRRREVAQQKFHADSNQTFEWHFKMISFIRWIFSSRVMHFNFIFCCNFIHITDDAGCNVKVLLHNANPSSGREKLYILSVNLLYHLVVSLDESDIRAGILCKAIRSVWWRLLVIGINSQL